MKQFWVCIIIGVMSWQGLSLRAQDVVEPIQEQFSATSLPHALEQLSETYGWRFAYDPDALSDIEIEGAIKANGVVDALNQLLENIPVSYQILPANQILIRREAAAKVPMQRISGRVFTQESVRPLRYATLTDPNRNWGAVTDEAGNFELVLPDTVATIRVHYFGYAPKVVSIQTLKQNASIYLTPQVHEIASITIADKMPLLRPFASGTSLSLRGEAAYQLPTSVGIPDIFRQLQLLPGMGADDDLSSEINIRGGNGDESKIVMDGITLYQVGHYFGIFSTINPQIVDEVKVYKNAFPVEHGGRTSGVVEINSLPFKPGDSRRVQGGLDLNVYSSGAYLQLPLTSNMNLLIGGRTTYQNLGNTQLFDLVEENGTAGISEKIRSEQAIFNEKPAYRFFDTNIKWSWNLNPQTQVLLSGFASEDKYSYEFNQAFKIRTPQQRQQITGQYLEETSWRNQGLHLQLNHRWNAHWQTAASINTSHFYQENTIGSSLITAPRGELDSLPAVEFGNDTENSIVEQSLKVKQTWTPSLHQRFVLGYEGTQHQVNHNFIVDRNSVNQQDRTVQQHSVFAQYHHQWNDKWEVTLGLRGTDYALTPQLYVSPRVHLSYQLNNHLQLKGSVSRYYQFLKKLYYEDRLGRTTYFWVLADEIELPISRSNHGMLGAQWKKGTWFLDVEGYYKATEGVVEFAQQALGSNPTSGGPSEDLGYQTYQGEGRAFGVDVLLRKTGKFYKGWLAYTWSKTENRFPEVFRNVWFPAQTDRRHQVKWVNQFQWNRWSLSATYVFSKGRPYTDLSQLSEEKKDRKDLSPSSRVSRLPDYHRVDIGLTYEVPVLGHPARLGFSVFNVLNRENVKYRQYIYTSPRRVGTQSTVVGTDFQQLDRTLSVSLGWEF